MRFASAGRSSEETSASRSKAGASEDCIRALNTVRGAPLRSRTMHVRAMRAGEGQRLRELRLRALRDTPEAFSSWPEREEAFDSQEWEARGETVFIAESGGEWLGMVGTFVDPDLPAICNVWGTWVDPRARGRGAGRALMEAAVESARAAGLRRVELGVSDRAPAAAALYERLGF